MLGLLSFVRRFRWALFALAAVAAVGTAVVVSRPETPGAVADLEELERAGGRASAESERIVENLRDIAENLGPGATLEAESGEIHDLTERQRESLEELIGILEQQLDALGRTKETLERAGRSTEEIAALTEQQSDLLRRSVAALQRLEGFADSATRSSGELAAKSRYGARLAEDSARRFGGP